MILSVKGSIVCVLMVLAGCTSSDFDRSKVQVASVDLVPHYVLYSWRGVSKHFRFAIVTEDQWRSFVVGRRTSGLSVANVGGLQLALDRLPKPSLVIWADAPSIGLIYPPKDVVRSIKDFAGARRIDLRVEPSIEE